MSGAVSPHEEPLKAKSLAINLNATVDVAYADDYRNHDYVKQQILEAVKKANIECTELVDIELEEVL